MFWKELQDVVLDVEVALNNRPLSYLEDDIQFPVLTPNTFLFEQPNLLPELEPYHLEDGDLRKRAKHIPEQVPEGTTSTRGDYESDIV